MYIMATTRKRGNSYQIRVSCGYDTSGNQVVQTMTLGEFAVTAWDWETHPI